MAGTIIADTWQNGDGSQNYKCRAWVNFNGTGTVAIRASGNISSITDRSVGVWSVNLIIGVPNGSAIGSDISSSTDWAGTVVVFADNSTASSNTIYPISARTIHPSAPGGTGNVFDADSINVAIFG